MLVTPVVQDWHGAPLLLSFSFLLQPVSIPLTFGAVFPPGVRMLGKPGEFVEGLWNESVVELFIHDLASNCYIELNLSPSGAYWGAVFHRYRERASEFRLEAEAHVEVIPEGVRVTQVVPSDVILFNEFVIAQTAILSTDSGTKSYLTRKFASGESGESKLQVPPDFHRRELAENFTELPD
jgi:hypothetical protein